MMHQRFTFGTFFLLVGLTAGVPTAMGEEQVMRYEVHRLAAAEASQHRTGTGQGARANGHASFTIDADWNKPAWRNVQPLELTHAMGDRPQHFPRTQAKLLYDDQAIYVIFRVEDRYVRAVAQAHQDNVFADSCVEFFFAPAAGIGTGYFNLEMNCGGTMLFHYQVVPRQSPIRLSRHELGRVTVAHCLPRIVDPEITEPTIWTVEYRLPVDLLEKYYPAASRPAPGVTWRANFYKCADGTSHPHWLTWSRVDNPVPDFHVPRFFGRLEFQ